MVSINSNVYIISFISVFVGDFLFCVCGTLVFVLFKFILFMFIEMLCLLEFFDKVFDCSFEIHLLGSSRWFSLENIYMGCWGWGKKYCLDLPCCLYLCNETGHVGFFCYFCAWNGYRILEPSTGCVGWVGPEVWIWNGHDDIWWTQGNGSGAPDVEDPPGREVRCGTGSYNSYFLILKEILQDCVVNPP